MKLYNVGIIGCGAISKNYARFAKEVYFDYYKITAVGDICEEKAKALAEAFDIPKYGNPDVVYNDPTIDIVINLTVPMAHRHADGIHLAGVKSYFKSVLTAALRAGEVEFTSLSGNHRAESKTLAELEAHLWDYSFVPEEREDDTSVSVYSVADRYEEAEALCAFIAEKVRGGARYSDIAVVAANVSALRGITDSAMRRHGIPVFTSESEQITSSPAVRLILSLLRVVGRWRREDVISMVKTGLTPLSDELACAFESYTDTWNIRGRSMFTSVWSMNPDGYVETLSDRGRQTLILANDARERLIPPIERFCTVFDGGSAEINTNIIHMFPL